MIVRRRMYNQGGSYMWPGFVDALSTLLMVIIFVLMILFLAQFSMSFLLKNQESNIYDLQKEIESITHQLHMKSQDLESILKDRSEKEQRIQTLENLLRATKGRLLEVQGDLRYATNEKNVALDEKNQLHKIEEELLGRVHSLNEQINQLTVALHTSENSSLKSQKQLAQLQEQLAQTTANAHLQRKKSQEESMSVYRSEFFGKLKEIIGERSDMRVVGDRFVFQSEVFFDEASSLLSSEGRKQLDQLAHVIKDLNQKISSKIKWILRVDGHTDHRSIHTAAFPSNWELSTARAIAVVKHLISKGIAPERLVAAGFGEFQPMTSVRLREADLARNRRIEFKLDQR